MSLSNLDKNKTYLLACSYGPDSMAAFHLLLTHNYNFDVAIVNYHLRKESDDEVSGLKDYCDKYNKTLHILDVKEPIEGNIENRCREIRYNYFKELVNKYGYEGVITAHQQDDHIETYLIQKNRKLLTKTYGMAEFIEIFGVKVYRPFLGMTKKEMEEMCLKNEIPFAIDSSNLEDKFLRNQIRHNTVSKMTDVERKNILEEIDNKNLEVAVILNSIDWSKKDIVFYALSLNDITYLYFTYSLVNEIDCSYQLSKKQALEIRKVLMSSKPNIISKIYNNLYLVKSYDQFHFVANLNLDESYSYTLDKPAELDAPYFYLNFLGDTSNRNVFSDSYPLTIRNATADDIYFINGYEVKVRRLFIDWKMPIQYRHIWPVIVSTGHIIYIPRYQKDFIKEEDTNFYVKLK